MSQWLRTYSSPRGLPGGAFCLEGVDLDFETDTWGVEEERASSQVTRQKQKRGGWTGGQLDERWEEPAGKQGGHAHGLVLVRSPPLSRCLPPPGSALYRVPVGSLVAHSEPQQGSCPSSHPVLGTGHSQHPDGPAPASGLPGGWGRQIKLPPVVRGFYCSVTV